MFTDGPERNRQASLIHERLDRLNRELASEKPFDEVTATRSGHRIPVRVERCHEQPRHFVSDRDFKASAEFCGKRYFAYGVVPSHAFVRLTRMLEWAVDKATYEANLGDSNVISIRDRRAA